MMEVRVKHVQQVVLLAQDKGLISVNPVVT